MCCLLAPNDVGSKTADNSDNERVLNVTCSLACKPIIGGGKSNHNLNESRYIIFH